MAYFPSTMPGPTPNFDDREFWQACERRQLLFQTCADCGKPRHPPGPVCPSCRSLRTKWTEPEGLAEVYTYTVVHHASHEAVKERLPYVVGVVTFPDLPGVRLVTNITDIEPSLVRVGMQVRLWWDEIGGGMFIPRFSPITP
jgi:uncharacterized OB-fold protein